MNTVFLDALFCILVILICGSSCGLLLPIKKTSTIEPYALDALLHKYKRLGLENITNVLPMNNRNNLFGYYSVVIKAGKSILSVQVDSGFK